MIQDNEKTAIRGYQLTSDAVAFLSSKFNNPYATKPLSKGEKLEMLMDCGNRLNRRARRFLDNCIMADDHESKVYWLAKANRVEEASLRLSRKIRELMESR